MCIVRLEQGLGALTSVPTVEVSVLECCASEEGSEEPLPFALLDADFFDSEVLVIVYRPKDQQGEWAGAVLCHPCGRCPPARLSADASGGRRSSAIAHINDR